MKNECCIKCRTDWDSKNCPCECHKPQEVKTQHDTECKGCGGVNCKVKESDWESEKNKIKEEFHLHSVRMAHKVENDVMDYSEVENSITYFWLQKIDKIKLQQKQDLLKELEEEVEDSKKYPTEDQEDGLEYDEGYDDGIDKVLALIKSKKI